MELFSCNNATEKMKCFLPNNKDSNQPTTSTTMAQQQQQARQILPFYQNREFIQGKLEIEEDIRIKFGKITHELYPETILMLDTALCEWVRDNYSEMVQILHQDAFTEYEDSRELSEIFYDKVIAVSS